MEEVPVAQCPYAATECMSLHRQAMIEPLAYLRAVASGDAAVVGSVHKIDCKICGKSAALD